MVTVVDEPKSAARRVVLLVQSSPSIVVGPPDGDR